MHSDTDAGHCVSQPGLDITRRAATWYELFILAAMATVLSIAIQRFFFGYANNTYHIPIVLKLFDAPPFLDDPFYQSLRNFTSIVWPAMSAISTPANIRIVFFCAHLLSRFLLYAASIGFFVQLGRRDVLTIGTGLLLLSSARVFSGYSFVGATGMQIPYFTHTELCYPLALAALMLVSARRDALAFAMNGLIFNVNAFTGVWLGGILPIVVLSRPTRLAERARRVLIGTALEVVVAVPTILWILRTLEGSRGAPAFDYVGFLAFYYPKHFLILKSHNWEIFQFLSTCVSDALALNLLGGMIRPWRVAFYSFIAFFGMGAVVPFVTGSRLLLNLHWLRIDGMITLLSTLFVIVAAANIYQREWRSTASGRAVAVLATLCIGDWRMIAVAMGLLVHEFPGSRRLWPKAYAAVITIGVMLTAATQVAAPAWSRSECVLVAMVCLVLAFAARDAVLGSFALVTAAVNWPLLCVGSGVCLGGAILWSARRAVPEQHLFTASGAQVQNRYSEIDSLSGIRRLRLNLVLLLVPILWGGAQRASMAWRPDPKLESWQKIQEWARQQTPLQAQFLVPPDYGGFQLGSRRKVWVEREQGAAVLWMPSFYGTWISRYRDVAALKNQAEFCSYAHLHGIEYYVLDGAHAKGRGCLTDSMVFGNVDFQVYRVSSGK